MFGASFFSYKIEVSIQLCGFRVEPMNRFQSKAIFGGLVHASISSLGPKYPKIRLVWSQESCSISAQEPCPVWPRSSKITQDFLLINDKNSFDPRNLAPFQLKNLALCDLEARMANLDSAMDSEIDSLRRRYDLVTAAIYPLQMRWIRFMGMIGYGGVSFSYGCIDSVMDSEIDSLRTRHDFGYGEYF